MTYLVALLRKRSLLPPQLSPFRLYISLKLLPLPGVPGELELSCPLSSPVVSFSSLLFFELVFVVAPG